MIADDSPHFAMKWIQGRTLGELLAQRADLDDDRRRFLSIVEAALAEIMYDGPEPWAGTWPRRMYR